MIQMNNLSLNMALVEKHVPLDPLLSHPINQTHKKVGQLLFEVNRCAREYWTI